MTKEYQRTLCDIDFILNYVDENVKNRIPMKLQKFIYENKLENYTSEINIHVALNKQELHKDTKAFLAMLYLNYWCTNQEEKEAFQNKLDQNEIDYQNKLQEKYSIDNLFKNNDKTVIEEAENLPQTAMIEYKEGIIRKIINKIKEILNKY